MQLKCSCNFWSSTRKSNELYYRRLKVCLCSWFFQELLRRWTSLQHHITGVHRWEENGTEYRCFHQDLSAEEQRTKRWLKGNSPAFKALQAMIMDTRLIKDLQQMTLFKHTGMCIKDIDKLNSNMGKVKSVLVRIDYGKLICKKSV
jgi:hypothetical protein